MQGAITEDFRDAENELREEFGTETFKVGKKTIECRTSGGDISQDFGDDGGSRRKMDRVTAVAFKDEWAGRPYSGQGVTWVREDGEVKMRVSRARGGAKVSPTWSLELVSV